MKLYQAGFIELSSITGFRAQGLPPAFDLGSLRDRLQPPALQQPQRLRWPGLLPAEVAHAQGPKGRRSCMGLIVEECSKDQRNHYVCVCVCVGTKSISAAIRTDSCKGRVVKDGQIHQ